MSEEILDYVWMNYYGKINLPKDLKKRIRKDVLRESLMNLEDRMIIIRKDKEIALVAIYYTLSDESYAKLEEVDMTLEDVVRGLAYDHGNNIHFILVAGGGYATIRMGIEEVKRRCNPKTISWWSPDMKRLHKYRTKE